MYQLCPDRSEFSNEFGKCPNAFIPAVVNKCTSTQVALTKYEDLNFCNLDWVHLSFLGDTGKGWPHLTVVLLLFCILAEMFSHLHFSWTAASTTPNISPLKPLCLSAPPPGIFKDISISNKFASVLTRTLFADSCILSPDLKRGAAPHNWNANDQPPAELQTNMKAIIY